MDTHENNFIDNYEYFFNSNIYNTTCGINLNNNFTDMPCYDYFCKMSTKYNYILAASHFCMKLYELFHLHLFSIYFL